MDVISLQSRVKTGYVGNAVAVPTLAWTGATPHPVDSVTFPHHPGHGPVTPQVTPTDALANALAIAMDACAGPPYVLSGYLANAAQGRALLDFITDARTSGRISAWYLDPVFGDDPEGTYVDAALVDFFREAALPACTCVLPNRYELSLLSGTRVDTVEDAVTAARTLISLGPESVLASSVPAAGGSLANVLVTAREAWGISVPKRPLRAKGTGDMLSAAFTGLRAEGLPALEAAQSAVAAVDAAVRDASDRDLLELEPDKILISLNFNRKGSVESTYTELLEQQPPK